MARIETMETLRAIYGAPKPRSVAKQLDHIDRNEAHERYRELSESFAQLHERQHEERLCSIGRCRERR